MILSDPPYHIIALPGRELKNEDLKVIARLFMEIDKISTLVVRIIDSLVLKSLVKILTQPRFGEP